MPSGATPSLRLEAQATGENTNVWGVLLDQALTMIDASAAGIVPIALTGDYTLTAKNFVADEARNAILKFTGMLAANATVTIPSVSKIYLAWNAANKVVNVTTGSGDVVAIDAGDILLIFCDATNVETLSYGGLALKDFITASSAGGGALPSPVGNAGKYLYDLDGTNIIWRQPSTADLSDYNTKVLGTQVALAVAL